MGGKPESPACACSRRTLLACGAVGGAIGLTGLTAACGGAQPPSENTDTGSGNDSAAAAGEVLVAAAGVPVGGGVVVNGVLVVQPTAGAFKAYSAGCTSPLSTSTTARA